MAPRGVAGVGVGNVSSCSVSLDIRSCGGLGLGEALLGLVEGVAYVVDRDCDELHFLPQGFESGDDGTVLHGILLKRVVASEVHANAPTILSIHNKYRNGTVRYYTVVIPYRIVPYRTILVLCTFILYKISTHYTYRIDVRYMALCQIVISVR